MSKADNLWVLLYNKNAMNTDDIYLPLKVQQLVNLVMQLPKKQKLELVNLLLEKDVSITEQQKELVRSRVKKYKANPGKLIPETEAWEKINAA